MSNKEIVVTKITNLNGSFKEKTFTTSSLEFNAHGEVMMKGDGIVKCGASREPYLLVSGEIDVRGVHNLSSFKEQMISGEIIYKVQSASFSYLIRVLKSA